MDARKLKETLFIKVIQMLRTGKLSFREGTNYPIDFQD